MLHKFGIFAYSRPVDSMCLTTLSSGLRKAWWRWRRVPTSRWARSSWHQHVLNKAFGKKIVKSIHYSLSNHFRYIQNGLHVSLNFISHFNCTEWCQKRPLPSPWYWWHGHWPFNTREIVTTTTEMQHNTFEGFCGLVALCGSFCNVDLLHEICWTNHSEGFFYCSGQKNKQKKSKNKEIQEIQEIQKNSKFKTYF